MENINAVLISDGMPQGKRLVKLNLNLLALSLTTMFSNGKPTTDEEKIPEFLLKLKINVYFCRSPTFYPTNN